MKAVFFVLFVIHGLIHLMGFVKAFDLAPVNQLTQHIPKPVGLVWLLVSLLFIISAILYFFDSTAFWLIGVLSILSSQMLILFFWSDAKYGTIANIILIIPVLFLNGCSFSAGYAGIFRNEVEEGLHQQPPSEILTGNDIQHLPSLLQKYLRYSGAVGREKVQNFRAEFYGKIKPKPDSDFLDFHAVQYNFYHNPGRYFYIRSKMLGLPFEALHEYAGPHATMRVKIASLLKVVDAKGPEMDKSETVTMFNDMCFLAPPTLIDTNIVWEPVDSLTVNAEFTHQGHTITATLFFNEEGQLVNFSSHDRSETADGKTYNNYQWTTPLKDYKDFNGIRVASYGEAFWHKPDGEFCYGKFHLKDIQYNCTEYEGF